MPVMIDFRDKEEWTRVAEKYDMTENEAGKVAITFTLRGVAGNYEEELKQLDKGPYSNDFSKWYDNKIREILIEIRPM